MLLRETQAITVTPSSVFLPRRGTSPGCLQALFRLGTYPGSFNPRQDGKSCWHCWQREEPSSFVPLVEHTSQQVPGWGGSLAGSTGQPLSHLDVRWPKESIADLPAGGDSHHKQGLLQGGNSRGSPGELGTRRMEEELSGKGPLGKHKERNDPLRKGPFLKVAWKESGWERGWG